MPKLMPKVMPKPMPKPTVIRRLIMPTRPVLIIAALSVLGAPASAQDTPAASAATGTSASISAGSVATPARMPWPAPVGHRQPRPQDVGMPKPDRYEPELQRLQRALDGRLRICGGC